MEHVQPAVDLGQRRGLAVEDVDPLRVVDEGELRAVGGPERPVAEPRSERGHDLRLAGAGGPMQRQLVLAPAVAPRGDPPAVR